MSMRLTKKRWTMALLAMGVALGMVATVWQYGLKRPPQPGPDAAPDSEFPLPAMSSTHFLNTGPDARYIGIDACAKCHADKLPSYRLTAHSQALADLDSSSEPVDGSFEQKASGRSYRVYRRDNQMFHEEIVRTASGEEIARVEAAISYRIGSGNFTRSYLAEIDGFMQESPITWYASKKRWDMSPGYDVPQHPGFERGVGLACLRCHAGNAEAIPGTLHRIMLHEKAIGCESCHGPGSLHQQLQRGKSGRPDGADDVTIVNPRKLERPLLEAICAACHLNGVASVALRGHDLAEYRPGRPLTDYRVDYRLETSNEQMTVVGHVEQLRRSACYQKSPRLTCVTCHNPHAREKPRDPVAFYRQKCLSCHTVEACGLPAADRLKKDAADNCLACHMPRGDTEIPHIAFTHHRIGRHGAKGPAAGSGVPDLVPVYDVTNLSALDRQRSLGMAYHAASQQPACAKFADVFRARALKLLEAAHAAGLRDADTAGTLAELNTDMDRDRARAYLREELTLQKPTVGARAMALQHLSHYAIQDNDFKSAIGMLEEAVLARRYAEDWHLLGVAYLSQRQPLHALSALQQALAIRPYRPRIHAALAEVYQEVGDSQHAREHMEKARWLIKHEQD